MEDLLAHRHAQRQTWLAHASDFSFLSLWSETGGQFIYSEQLKTLPYALNQIIGGGIARAGVGAAVGVIMMIVPITVFVINQSKVIDTMGASGIK